MNFQKLRHFLECLDGFDVQEFDISVYHNHKEVFRYLRGHTNSEKEELITNDSFRWIYSMTKVITCAAVLRLVEQGKLSLEDRVSKYLPEYEKMTVKTENGIIPAKNPILVRHLFAMQSGMDYSANNSVLNAALNEGRLTTRELVGEMAKRPLSFEPGEKYQYGLSHDVLAAVAEVVSGKSWHNFLKDELFIPLDMKNIGFHPTEEQLKFFTEKYKYDNELFRCKSDSLKNNFCLSPLYESGGAGLFSTVDEYMKIIDALANFGTAANGYQVLKPETVNLMRKNQVPDNACINKAGYGYGLGVRTLIDKAQAKSLSPIGEFGWDGAASSYNVIDPENKLAIGFFTHIIGTSFFNNVVSPQIRNLIYDALEIGTNY